MHRAIIACCRRTLKAAAIDLRDRTAARYYGDRPGAAAMATAAAPVAVVSPQFCSPDVVPLTVTNEPKFFSDGHFTVTDANGGVVLRVKGSFFNDRRVLLDAAGRPILSMQEKVKLFSLHKSWEVFRGDSFNASDLLFTAKTLSIFQVKVDMDILLASNTAEQVCDFKIKQGSYFDRSFAFYHGNSNNMIAQMDHQSSIFNVLLGNKSVTVFPHVDYVFITALVVIVDQIQREELRWQERERERRSQRYQLFP